MPDLRLATAVGAAIVLGTVELRRHLPESLRWLETQGRHRAAARIVDGIVRGEARSPSEPRGAGKPAELRVPRWGGVVAVIRHYPVLLLHGPRVGLRSVRRPLCAVRASAAGVACSEHRDPRRHAEQPGCRCGGNPKLGFPDAGAVPALQPVVSPQRGTRRRHCSRNGCGRLFHGRDEIRLYVSEPPSGPVGEAAGSPTNDKHPPLLDPVRWTRMECAGSQHRRYTCLQRSI